MNQQTDALISDLKHLHSSEDTTNFGVLDFLSAFGSPVEAAAYGKLFWPDFVEVDGVLLRSDVIENESDADRVRDALRQWNDDLEKTERSFNRLDVPSGIFANRTGESSDETDEQLGELLREMWEAKLARTYPTRTFSVTLDQESDGEFSVTFCQLGR